MVVILSDSIVVLVLSHHRQQALNRLAVGIHGHLELKSPFKMSSSRTAFSPEGDTVAGADVDLSVGRLAGAAATRDKRYWGERPYYV